MFLLLIKLDKIQKFNREVHIVLIVYVEVFEGIKRYVLLQILMKIGYLIHIIKTIKPCIQNKKMYSNVTHKGAGIAQSV
jgi:hypothetical protein